MILKAVIIDDEVRSREFLKNLVTNYLKALSLEDPSERESLFKKDIEVEDKKKKK